MQWSDEGIVIHTRRYGENKLIASVLTHHHGRHLGLLRQSSKINTLFQPGCKLAVKWNARLIEHLGHWTSDLLYSPLVDIFDDSIRLAALGSACSLVEIAVPEREPNTDIYQAFDHFISVLTTNIWPDAYIHLEATLLSHAGIKFDFSHCAATGSTEDLIYLSPRTGRAISREAGVPYHDKLLTLPSFLTQNPNQSERRRTEDILKALEMTEIFLERFIIGIHQLRMPEARSRLKARLRRHQERN